MIEQVEQKLADGRQMWLMDDGFFMGSSEDTLVFWNLVKKEGSKSGYRVNKKSKVYDVNSEK